VALRVQQQVGGLQVTVKQVGRVHVLEALEDLVHDVLLVNVFEDIGSNDGVQVGVHEVKYQVNIAVVFGTDHIL
jgi:hypothetical protein